MRSGRLSTRRLDWRSPLGPPVLGVAEPREADGVRDRLLQLEPARVVDGHRVAVHHVLGEDEAVPDDSTDFGEIGPPSVARNTRRARSDGLFPAVLALGRSA